MFCWCVAALNLLGMTRSQFVRLQEQQNPLGTSAAVCRSTHDILEYWPDRCAYWSSGSGWQKNKVLLARKSLDLLKHPNSHLFLSFFSHIKTAMTFIAGNPEWDSHGAVPSPAACLKGGKHTWTCFIPLDGAASHWRNLWLQLSCLKVTADWILYPIFFWTFNKRCFSQSSKCPRNRYSKWGSVKDTWTWMVLDGWVDWYTRVNDRFALMGGAWSSWMNETCS